MNVFLILLKKRYQFYDFYQILEFANYFLNTGASSLLIDVKKLARGSTNLTQIIINIV